MTFIKQYRRAVLKRIRLIFFLSKKFHGRHFEIIRDRNAWFDSRSIFVMDEAWKRNDGARKVHKLVVYYAPNNFLTRALGFRVGKLHLQYKYRSPVVTQINKAA